MKTTIAHSFELIERTPRVLHALLSGLSDDWTHHNEGADTWTVKEAVAHLIVCEETDWLPRIRVILSDGPDRTLAPIDMEAHFALAQQYSMEEFLAEFQRLRTESIAEWQRFALTEADFTRSARHPRIGEVTLGELLATWVAHDLSHLTQIARILARQYKEEVGAFRTYLGIMGS